jgi:hypothetical protein
MAIMRDWLMVNHSETLSSLMMVIRMVTLTLKDLSSEIDSVIYLANEKDL